MLIIKAIVMAKAHMKMKDSAPTIFVNSGYAAYTSQTLLCV